MSLYQRKNQALPLVNVTGFAAGQHHTHYGEATNLACLPLSPEYHDYLAANTGNYIYGAEYETGSNIFGNLQNQNDPCARCYAPQRTTTIIIQRKDHARTTDGQR